MFVLVEPERFRRVAAALYLPLPDDPEADARRRAFEEELHVSRAKEEESSPPV